MRKILAGAVSAVSVVVAMSGPAGAVADDGIEITAVDAAAYPTVTAVVVTPPGPAGAAYTADSFEVLEAGSPVEASVERLPTDDLEVMLLLDTSGSMNGVPLESEKAAASEFLTLLPPEVRAGVVAYGSTPTLVSAPSTDRRGASTAIAPLVAATDTALYDAVIFAAGQFTSDAERRAIVLLTDGEDNVSNATIDAAAATAAEVPVHVIELVTDRTDRPALDRLAVAGGGTVTTASDPSALTELYRQAAGAVANQYQITYPSTGSGPVELTVRVSAGEDVLADTTTVELPAAAPVTTAAPATTTPATTTPATTSPPTTVPATTTPATTTPPAVAASADPGEPDGSNIGLLLGGGAVFVALLLFAAALLLGDGRRREVRAGLGLAHARAAGSGVTKLKQGLSARVDRFLERKGRSRSVAAALEAAGVSLRPGEFIVLVLSAATIGALLAFMLLGPLGLLATIVIVPFVGKSVLNRRAARRRAKFAELLPDTLQLLTSSLRSGYGLLPALDNVSQEAEEPARSEFRRVLLEIRVGRDPGDALSALAARMASQDFEWVVGAIDINREIGGDLALTLDNVAETIRDRQRLKRQVEVLTAEGRLSTYILIGLPVFLGLALSVMNPAYMEPLFSGVGLVLIAVGAGMLLAGWLWMKRLIRIEF